MKTEKQWIEKEDAIRAVNDEPELPGEMPDEMWNAIHNDRDAVAEALRIAVRQTKSGIIKRMAATPNNPDERRAERKKDMNEANDKLPPVIASTSASGSDADLAWMKANCVPCAICGCLGNNSCGHDCMDTERYCCLDRSEVCPCCRMKQHPNGHELSHRRPATHENQKSEAHD